LAHAAVDVQEAVLDTLLAGPDGPENRRLMAEIRRTGLTVCHRRGELGEASIAAAVRGRAGTVVASVSLRCVDARNPHSLTPAVHNAALSISEALAAAPRPQNENGVRVVLQAQR
jgi:DNA-binding IclR family transcriptional regulator